MQRSCPVPTPSGVLRRPVAPAARTWVALALGRARCARRPRRRWRLAPPRATAGGGSSPVARARLAVPPPPARRGGGGLPRWRAHGSPSPNLDGTPGEHPAHGARPEAPAGPAPLHAVGSPRPGRRLAAPGATGPPPIADRRAAPRRPARAATVWTMPTNDPW